MTITEAAEPPHSCKKYSGSALPGLSYTEFLRIRDELPAVLGDARWARAGNPAPALARLVALGHDRLPLPGSGATLARWQHLARIAAHDLSLVKLYEGHTDALAIIQELGGAAPASGSTWGTWAAEPPQARLRMSHADDGTARLDGLKAWCSGAGFLDHAVVSAWDEQDNPVLACVALGQPGVVVTGEGWHAIGMAATTSTDVVFHDATAVALGKPGDYVARPGFWQGGAGIAACWYGGARSLADSVRRACAERPEPFRLAHLGAIDVAMSQAAALLREAAAWIDEHPRDNAMAVALRVRAAAESAAATVLDHAGRALGAAPYCRDAGFARMAADLPVFVRQSHADQDLATLAQTLAASEETTWAL